MMNNSKISQNNLDNISPSKINTHTNNPSLLTYSKSTNAITYAAKSKNKIKTVRRIPIESLSLAMGINLT
jgi:hypothetical protein